MKTKIITAAFIVLSMTVFAGEKNKTSKTEAPANVCLTGTIVDEQSKETLAGVEVTIEGTSQKTYTDFEGKFSFDNIKPGQYKVTANIISYNKVQSTQVELKANEMHSLNLELTAQNSVPQLESAKNQNLMAAGK